MQREKPSNYRPPTMREVGGYCLLRTCLPTLAQSASPYISVMEDLSCESSLWKVACALQPQCKMIDGKSFDSSIQPSFQGLGCLSGDMSFPEQVPPSPFSMLGVVMSFDQLDIRRCHRKCCLFKGLALHVTGMSFEEFESVSSACTTVRHSVSMK